MSKNSHIQRRRIHHVPGTEPFSHQRTRDVQPQTESDTRPMRRALVLGAAATTLLIGANMAQENDKAEGVPTPPDTTLVTAQEGDTLWGLQQREGTNGRSTFDVVTDAMKLNGGSADIQPHQQVVLLDDPHTPPQP